jgi:signal transduction histidine kinase/CheY-like chemotaxis protein
MSRGQSVSFDIRTILTIMAILLISVFSSFAGLVVYSDYKFNQAVMVRSETILANGLLKGSMPLAVATNDIDLIKTIVHEHLAYNEIYAISVHSDKGVKLYSEENNSVSQLKIIRKTYKIISPYENYTIDTFNSDKTNKVNELGTVTISFSSEWLQDKVNKQLYLSIVVISLAIVACLILILAFSSFFSIKLKKLIYLIETIKTGQRIEIPQTQQNINELAVIDSHLRSMANTIFARDDELKVTLSNAIEAKITAQNAEVFKDDFIRALSHDIKTPVGVIVNLLEIINNEVIARDMDPAFIQKTSACFHSARLLADVTEELFNIDGFQHKKLINRKNNTNTSDFFNKISSLYEQKFTDKNLTFKVKNTNIEGVDIPDQVSIDGNKLTLILENLIDNAFKFTKEGIVTVSWKIICDTLHITVKDSGIGIPEENLTCIFEKHRQLGDTTINRHDGRGLGLFYVKKYIEVIGAELTISSKVGLGTVIEIIVPIEEYINLPYQLPMPANQAIRILIIDDDEKTCFMLTKLLEQMGVESSYECIPEIGFKRIINEAPDLVFIDYHMPNLTGDVITRRAKEILPPLATIYVCITAESNQDKLKMLDEIFYAVISKTFKSEEIRKIVSYSSISKNIASNIFINKEYNE